VLVDVLCGFMVCVCMMWYVSVRWRACKVVIGGIIQVLCLCITENELPSLSEEVLRLVAPETTLGGVCSQGELFSVCWTVGGGVAMGTHL
jgi:hypothetical protein